MTVFTVTELSCLNSIGIQTVGAGGLRSHSRGEDFRREVSDVGGDGPARHELSHLIGEGVAVVLKQTIPVTSEERKNGSFIHCDYCTIIQS